MSSSSYDRTAPSGDEFVDAFGTSVARDGDRWVLRAWADGQQRVISRHATEEAARSAARELNASANRDRASPPS
jgi:hypothetical protein